LFVGYCNGNFRSFDKDTGRLEWTYDIKKDRKHFSFHGAMLPLHDRVIVGTENPEGYVYAFSADSCHVYWKRFCGPGVYGDVVGDEDRVFAVTIQDTVLCLRPRTGELLWSFSTTDTTGAPTNKLSPCLADSLLLHVSRGGSLVALRANTGAVAWVKSLPTPIRTSLYPAGGSIYLSAPKSFYRIDPSNGNVRSAIRDSFRVTWPHGLADADDGLVAFSADSTGFHLASIDHELRRVTWRKSAPTGEHWSSLRPLVWSGFAIAGTDSGRVLAYQVRDGAPVWSLRVKGIVKIFGTEPGRLYVGTQDGAIYAFDR
jgi:outer membrane protein assembly factor BamB